ncbi:MAG: type IV conjugative transfer system protein TraL [Alphaproteobacteria bacterium]|nr:type IV conjugative transfer system protein TraL [Alphaproteobacteria bacterium]
MVPLLNYLDAPVRFLVLTMQEAMSVIVPFGLGIFYGQFWFGLLSACLFYGCVRWLSRAIGVRRFRGFYYWYFPTREKMYHYPLWSHVRVFVGCFVLCCLMGCSSVYNDMFDCPMQKVPACARVESVYARYMRLRSRKNQTWYCRVNGDENLVVRSVK